MECELYLHNFFLMRKASWPVKPDVDESDKERFSSGRECR